MIGLSPFGSLLTSAAVTTLLLPPLIRVLRRREIMDTPGRRSSHTTPTARGGGAALVGAVGLVAAVVGAPAAVVVTLVGFAVVGGVDDLRGLAAGIRLKLQITLAVTASLWLWSTEELAWPTAVLAGLLLVLYVNAFNFMDGINGISGLQSTVVAGACVIVGALTSAPIVTTTGAAVVGASLAFLPFNFPRAKVFLGDVGSYGLGAVLGLLLALVAMRIPVWAALLIPSVYLLDVLSTLLRRARSGARLTEAHREHVYQRLVSSGGSHVGVTTFVTSCSAVVAGAAVTAGVSGSTSVRLIALCCAAGVLAAYLASPYFHARWIRQDPAPSDTASAPRPLHRKLSPKAATGTLHAMPISVQNS